MFLVSLPAPAAPGSRLSSQPWRSRREGVGADKEALRLPDKAARHRWGSGRRRWHGQPGQEGDPPGTERWKAQGHRPQRRRAPQTVLCSSASAIPAGDHTCLPREPEQKPGPPPFLLTCARHVSATGARDTGALWSLAVPPLGAPGSNPAPYCGCQQSGRTTEGISVTEALRLHLLLGFWSCSSRQGRESGAVTRGSKWRDSAERALVPGSGHSPPAAAPRVLRGQPGANWGGLASAAGDWRVPFPPPPP